MENSYVNVIIKLNPNMMATITKKTQIVLKWIELSFIIKMACKSYADVRYYYLLKKEQFS